MKRILICPWIIYTFIAISCKTREDTPPQPNQPKTLEVLWQTQLVPSPVRSYFTIAMNPVLNEDYIVFGTEYRLHNKDAPVLFLDTASGNIITSWSDYGYGRTLYSGELTAQIGNFLFLSTQRSIDCINLNSATTNWSTPISNNGPHIYPFQDHIYTAYESYDNKSATIIRSPASQKKFEQVYSFTGSGSFNHSFDSFGFGELSNGDEVIVWKNRRWRGGQNRTDIFAFNLSADTLMWRNTDMDINSGIIPLQVDNDRVFGLVRKHAFCMDLLTGNMLWYRKVSDFVQPTWGFEFFDGDFLLYGDAMIIKGSSNELVSINKSNGTLRYVREDLDPGVMDRFTYFEGKIFFATEKGIAIVDPLLGDDMLKDYNMEQFDEVRSKIVIDPNRRVMYFHDGRFAYCVRIPNNL